jgi:hypothetical protein
MVIKGQEKKLIKVVCFAIVMFFISYMPFSAVMHIIKNIFDGR